MDGLNLNSAMCAGKKGGIREPLFHQLNEFVAGFGGAFNADAFFSKLLTRIFRSTISCCISLSVASDKFLIFMFLGEHIIK